jgi:hypothetical protein
MSRQRGDPAEVLMREVRLVAQRDRVRQAEGEDQAGHGHQVYRPPRRRCPTMQPAPTTPGRRRSRAKAVIALAHNVDIMLTMRTS